ncbi:TPA: hypothetical protein ACGGF9_004197, partial [Escherichia coli]
VELHVNSPVRLGENVIVVFPVVKSKLTPCIAVEFPLIVHLACPKNGKASKNKNQYFFINKTFNDKYKLALLNKSDFG